MKNIFFNDKNALFLLPTDENQLLNFTFHELKKYFNSVKRFNFVGYCHQNGIRNTESFIKNLISNEKIDIIITSPFATDYQLSVEFYASLKNKVKIVFWMIDDESYFDVYGKYYCQIADAVITCDYFSVFAYERLGIPAIFLMAYHGKEDYHPVEIDRDTDVCFVGDCLKSDRMEYINFLVDNGISVRTFGIGSKNGFVEWNKFSEIFSRSKINLNFTKLSKLFWVNKDEPLLHRVRANKGRPLEIALTKSFCLSEYSPSLKYLFEIGKEIDVFYNKEDLLEKIRYYLSNDQKREEISNNAYQKAIKYYESEVYFLKLLKELEDVLSEKKIQPPEYNEIFLSKNFKINSINGLTFSMFVLIKNRKIFYALKTFAKLLKYGFFIFLAGFSDGLVRVMKNILNKK